MWNVINGELQSEVDTSILKRFKSPREAFDHLERWYDPEKRVENYMKNSMTSPLPPTAAPMAEKVMETPDTILHTRFICTLPDE